VGRRYPKVRGAAARRQQLAGLAWCMAWSAALGVALAGMLPGRAAGQTDYYNLDKHRPLRIEDAYAAERFALEFQLSPLTLTRRGGALSFAPSLETKFGVLPGMELSAGLNADVERRDGTTRGGLGGVDVSALYNLNSETLGMPALGLRVTGHVPTGSDGGASLETRGIVTRVLRGAWRAHLNGAFLLGEHAAEAWWAGAALDRVLPFHALLLLGEAYWAQPRAAGEEGRVHTAAGLRYQLTPTAGLDAGLGTDWTGTDRADWRFTLGFTAATGVRPLMRTR
jgi:hypothetical protein